MWFFWRKDSLIVFLYCFLVQDFFLKQRYDNNGIWNMLIRAYEAVLLRVLNILEPEHTFWWDNLIMCWVVKSSVAVAKKWFFKIQLVHDSWMGPSHCMYRAKYFPAGTGAMVGFRDVVQTANLQAAQIAKVPVILHWFLKSCRLFQYLSSLPLVSKCRRHSASVHPV